MYNQGFVQRAEVQYSVACCSNVQAPANQLLHLLAVTPLSASAMHCQQMMLAIYSQLCVAGRAGATASSDQAGRVGRGSEPTRKTGKHKEQPALRIFFEAALCANNES